MSETNLLVPEILEKFENIKAKSDKIRLIKQHETPLLRTLLRLNYDPNLSMNLPVGTPPYKKEVDKPVGYNASNLTKEYRRFYIWLSPQNTLPKLKKEALFVSLCESIHWTEAEVLICVKDRTLQTKYKSLSVDIVREAYPGLLPFDIPKPVTTKVTAPLE